MIEVSDHMARFNLYLTTIIIYEASFFDVKVVDSDK